VENFIIIDADNYMRDVSVKVLKKYLYTSGEYYDIHEFDKFSVATTRAIENIKGTKIYLIDVSTPASNGYKIAKWIRDNGDVTSPIILVSDKANVFTIKSIKNLLIFNCIVKDDNYILELMDTIINVHKMVSKYEAFTFANFDEVHRILLDKIYYIEKNMHNDSVTIFTDDSSYFVYSSIKKLENELIGDPRFFKSHRSCIINLHHIKEYHRVGNVVIFDNGMKIDLVCRARKKLFNERLLNLGRKIIEEKEKIVL